MFLCLLGKGTAIALANLCRPEGSSFEPRCEKEIFFFPFSLRPAPGRNQPSPQWVPGLLPRVIFTISRAWMSYGLISIMCPKVRHPWESNPRTYGLRRSAYHTQTTYDILILKIRCGGVFMSEITCFSVLLRAVIRMTQFHKYWPAVCWRHLADGRTDTHERRQ